MDLSSYTVWTIVPPWFGLPWTFFLWMFFPSGPFFRGPSFLNPNVCMVWHHFTSPGSAHRSPPSLSTLAFCRSTQTVRPPDVYLDIRSTGVLLIGPVVLECSSLAATKPSPSTSSDNPWKLIFSTIILTDCVSFYTYMCSVFLGSVSARAFVTVSV